MVLITILDNKAITDMNETHQRCPMITISDGTAHAIISSMEMMNISEARNQFTENPDYIQTENHHRQNSCLIQ